MTTPISAREALIAEAIGEAGKLIRQVEALAPVLDASRQALVDARADLTGVLSSFESQMVAVTDRAKELTAKHIASRADEAARRSIKLQERAMADAARLALGAEVGAQMQRLHALVRSLAGERRPAWEAWLTHTASASIGSLVTWLATTAPWRW